MDIRQLLDIKTREEFRKWLSEYSMVNTECWLPVKKGKVEPIGMIRYLDAVEEALCFGWIDSTVKTVDGVTVQRFSPRRKGSNWTELNKERCRRLIRLGLMTERGMAVLPDLSSEYEADPEILNIFKANRNAWNNFQAFHPLYCRVRLDKIYNEKRHGRMAQFYKKLNKLIEASEKGEMVDEWSDFGRLLNY